MVNNLSRGRPGKNRNLMVYVLSFNGLVVGGVGHYGSLNDINEWRSCRFLYFRL